MMPFSGGEIGVDFDLQNCFLQFEKPTNHVTFWKSQPYHPWLENKFNVMYFNRL